jgi:hypothetical protein
VSEDNAASFSQTITETLAELRAAVEVSPPPAGRRASKRRTG